ncbi:MAG: hypothetical protein ACUVXF_10530 [Desulfobaccales bacterium]
MSRPAILLFWGCAAIFCNTVGRAQEVYAALKPYFPALEEGDGLPELDLFQACCLFQDRKNRERRCLIHFSKTGGRVASDDNHPVKVQ